MDANTISSIGELVQRYGLGVVLSIVIVLLLWALLKFLMVQWNKMVDGEKSILDQAAKERTGWQTIMDGFLSTLKDHATDAKHRYKGLEEGNRYQREEHQRMLDALHTISGEMRLIGKGIENAVSTLKTSHEQRADENKSILEFLKNNVYRSEE